MNHLHPTIDFKVAQPLTVPLPITLPVTVQYEVQPRANPDLLTRLGDALSRIYNHPLGMVAQLCLGWALLLSGFGLLGEVYTATTGTPSVALLVAWLCSCLVLGSMMVGGALLMFDAALGLEGSAS